MEATEEDGVHELRVGPDAWPDALADIEGPQIVVGGPGTGKTEFLVRRTLHLIEEGGVPAAKLLVVGFGRRGTSDLEQRIRLGLSGSVPQIDVSTFHSLAARILEKNATDLGWRATPQILTGPEQVDLVQRLLTSTERSEWSPIYRDLMGSSTFAREVTDFVLRSREQLLSAGRLAEMASDRADWRGLPGFISEYDAALRATERIDYGTLLASAVLILESEEYRRDSEGPAFILVDEYQDTTVAEARLLELLVSKHGNLTAAADPYQSIYSFRGADLHNVDRFPTQYPDRNGAPGKRIVLTTSFRTPAAILDAAVRVTSGELPGAAGPVIPAAGNGRVDVYRFDQETEEAEWVAAEMQRLHLEDGIPYSRIGVLVRSKRRFIPDLIRALDRRDIPHSTPDARLSERSAVRFVLDLVAASTGLDGPAGTTRAIRRILLGPLYELPLGSLRAVERARLASPTTSWADAIRSAMWNGGEIADLLEDDSWATEFPASEGLWHVWNHLSAVERVVVDHERTDEREAWSSLSQVLRRWNERNPRSSLAEYRRLTQDEEFEARPLLSYRAAADDMPVLTTLHQSKGLEFDVVFIADAVEGVFPDLRTRDSLLGVRHLIRHLPADAAAYRAFRLQEERRLAYTAMSRARHRVIWTATATGFEEGRGIPSRFLALVAGSETVAEATSAPPTRDTPVTAREAEGFLRRLLVDPEKPVPWRLAALTVLAEHQDDRLRRPLTFAGMRHRGPDTGVIPDLLTMSPSQAESYDKCPRRYALERRLRIGSTTSVYVEFGSLIHAILEKVETEAVETGELHGDLDDAILALDDQFDPAIFGGAPFSDAWYQRGLRALTHLYQNWPSSAHPVALEHVLELRIEDTRWVGRADRIEATTSGLAIVDYKTSASPPRIADAAESMQLGFYALATAADPELAAHGPPERAEMWFPAARGKSVKTRSFDLNQLPTVSARLITAAEGISAEDWTPRPGPGCDRCSLRPLCPAWMEGREAFA